MDYRTQSGDTMSGIAQKFGVSLTALENANPQIENPSLIFPNELVHVPGSVAPAHDVAHVPPVVVTYVVRPGDTMSGIAEAHGMSLAALEAANPQISDPNNIHPGEVLNLKSSGSGHQPAVSSAGAIAIGAVTYARHSGGGAIDSWISSACQLLGLTTTHWLPGYRQLCQRESSFGANAINNWDSNAWGPVQADGYPLHCSRGVAQCIPDTFAAHHAPRTSTDIYDPVANIAASMRYVMSRYGVSADGSNLAAKVQQANPKHPPGGY